MSWVCCAALRCAAQLRVPTIAGATADPCRLDEVGYGVGLRLLEVLAYRERGQRRETRLLGMLKFVHRWAA